MTKSAREPTVPSGTKDDPRPVVLVTAQSERCGSRALDHAINLFGPAHRYVVVGAHRRRNERSDTETLVDSVAHYAPELTETLVLAGDSARAVCEAAHRFTAAAVVVGVDLASDGRTAPSHAFRLLRRMPCPVVLVATDAP